MSRVMSPTVLLVDMIGDLVLTLSVFQFGGQMRNGKRSHAGEVKYKAHKINPISYYHEGRNGWLPVARMSRQMRGRRFIFTLNGESIFPTKELADSQALELGKDWIDRR
jgi:hypothetical protein